MHTWSSDWKRVIIIIIIIIKTPFYNHIPPNLMPIIKGGVLDEAICTICTEPDAVHRRAGLALLAPALYHDFIS
jgi:hypothetical protein